MYIWSVVSVHSSYSRMQDVIHYVIIVTTCVIYSFVCITGILVNCSYTLHCSGAVNCCYNIIDYFCCILLSYILRKNTFIIQCSKVLTSQIRPILEWKPEYSHVFIRFLLSCFFLSCITWPQNNLVSPKHS